MEKLESYREETQHSSLDSDRERRSDSVRYGCRELLLLLRASGVCGRIALLESEFYSTSHQSLIIYIDHIKLHAAGAQQAGVRAGPKNYYIYCIQGSWFIGSVVSPEVGKMEAAIFARKAPGYSSTTYCTQQMNQLLFKNGKQCKE